MSSLLKGHTLVQASGNGHSPEPELAGVAPQDGGLYSWLRENLFVPVVCDVLDSLGYRQQAMHQRLRPLDPNNCTFAGRARTFLWVETEAVNERDPYELEIQAMDSLRPHDVAVHSTDANLTNAPWGELMSTVAKRNGAVGCVCDSNIRDCRKIMKMAFPVFHVGVRPVDSKGRGRVTAYDISIRCGEVLVQPGELMFADFDGVVVIPKAVEAQVLELAFEKVSKENASRRELLKGRSLREVFDQFGVL
jgi:4-hydroxy-4-methyl-2-oxoglutarate aldolase